MITQSELRPGEQLIWSGQPAGGIRFRPSDIVMIPFSLMWAGFACFWEFGVLTSYLGSGPIPGRGGPPFFFVLWGIPFVCIGLYITIGRFFHDAWLRQQTYYAVTDRRIIMVTNGFTRKFRSLDLRQLPAVELQTGGSGLGSISFGPGYGASGGNLAPGYNGRRESCAIELIPDARRVYEIIEDARDRALKNR